MERIRTCLVVSMVTVLAGLAFVAHAGPVAATPSSSGSAVECGATMGSGETTVCADGGSGGESIMKHGGLGCNHWHIHRDGSWHCHGGGH